MATIAKIKENFKNFKANSAWARGVKECAEHLIYHLEEAIEHKDLAEDTDIRDILHTINGCDTWTDYSHGACFCVTDGEVAEMCLTPSQLKQFHFNPQTKYVDERKDGRDWLDIQALLLWQAEAVLLRIAVEKNLPNRATSMYATRK